MSNLKIGDGDALRPRGRPRGFDRGAALDAIMLTFWRKGYRATSLDDLVEATGAPRASLYRLYGDKRGLFVAAIEAYARKFVDRVERVMAEEPDTRRSLQRILDASVERLAGNEAPDGCLRCNSTLEMADVDPVIDAALANANRAFVETIARPLLRGVERGEIARQDADRFALYLTAIVNGMVTLARSGADRDTLQDIVEDALARLDQIARTGERNP